MYESRHQPLTSMTTFVARLLRHLGGAIVVIAFSLVIGMTGYMTLEKLRWIDALLNSAMLLGGMGPVDLPKSDAGKIFASVYALYAGLVFVATTALIFTPIIHRVVHHLHMSDEE